MIQGQYGAVSHHFICLLVASAALFGCIQHCSADSGSTWGYEGANGPDHWPGTCASGSSQSPINIVPSTAESKDVEILALNGYDTAEGHGFTLGNNGHTVQLSVNSGPEMTVSGGELAGTFKLAQFHFHWGADDNVGSEHTVDAKQFPLEIHFVHINTKYDSAETALTKTDGVAVIGVFVKVGNQANDGMEKLLAKFGDVKYEDGSASVDSFALRSLLPSNTKDLYRYSGSLTTPECNEVVTWTVLKDPITITAAQMAKFRELRQGTSDASALLVNNFRPVQALNGRKVYLMHAITQPSSAPTVNSGRLPVAAACLAAFFWALAARF